MIEVGLDRQFEEKSRTVYRRAFLDALRPEPALTVSEWADENRVLSTRSSAEPGRWRTDRTPYLREIMDCLSARSRVERVIVMKGSQVGGTEIGNNWLGYIIDHAPGPTMVVMPTEGVQKRKSRQTLDPLIEDTPAIANKVVKRKSRDSGNTTLMKLFPGGMLVLASAMSAADLRSMPVRYLFADEIDAFPDELEGEGDPDELAERGTRTFRNRKVFKVSTPTTEHGSKIARQFKATDRRFYHVPCPHCGELQRITWDRITWDGADDDDTPREEIILDLEEGRREAWLLCVECGERIDEHHKTEMMAGGRWIPEEPDRGTRVRGYHLSALYSPFGMYSWAMSVTKHLKALGSPERLKVWVNQDLGETWKDKGEAPEWERLYRNREEYERNRIPAGAGLLTAGVDVQGDRIEVELVAWGPGLESWSVDFRVILGRPEGEEVWEALDELLLEDFGRQAADLPALKVNSLAIDSGAYTQRVYTWVRKYGRTARVNAIKGRTGQGTFLGIPSLVDVMAQGRRIVKGCRVWPVDSGLGKEEVYGLLNHEPPIDEERDFPPGYCHFPAYGPEFFKNITSEVLVRRRVKSGKIALDWEVLPGRRNEPLDCRVYARAAAAILGIDRWTGQHWEQLLRGTSGQDDPEPRERKRGGRWQRGRKRT